ncbi:metallophosphoesterase, partial [Bacillus vallismortis]|nr:metallophosphoesterase [Bacillus vallismortis]
KRLVSFWVPVLFVWGNNDYEIRQHSLYYIFKAHGVISLGNESVSFSHSGHTIGIARVDDIKMEMDHYEEAIKELHKSQL